MMKEHAILAVLWALFCFFHSLFASVTFKQKAEKWTGKHFKHFRLFYTLFAFATLAIVVYYQLNLLSPLLFVQNMVTNTLGSLIALTGLVIMLVCIKKYFISLSGIKSLFQEQPKNKLMIAGIHRFVRHPLYLGTFLFIWGLWILFPYASLLIANIAITVYTLIGIGLEENKLIAEFGEDYIKYKNTVPKLVPRFLLKRGLMYSTPK